MSVGSVRRQTYVWVNWWKCSFYPSLESLVNFENTRNSNHAHHLSVYACSNHIHYKCGDIVYLYSGFTRASNEIDSGTPHFLFMENSPMESGRRKKLRYDWKRRTLFCNRSQTDFLPSNRCGQTPWISLCIIILGHPIWSLLGNGILRFDRF